MCLLLPESAQPVYESFGPRSPGGPGLQRHADDRGAAAAVQPGSTDDHVPHPRVQVVPDAPAPAHRSALRPGIRLARLEKVSGYSGCDADVNVRRTARLKFCRFVSFSVIQQNLSWIL